LALSVGSLLLGPAAGAAAVRGPAGRSVVADTGRSVDAGTVPGGRSVVTGTGPGALSVVAGTGPGGPSTPGPAPSSELDAPFGLAEDGLGDLYVADSLDNEVDKVSPAGILSVVAGTGTAGTPTAGPATSSELNSPFGVAVDGRGDVYIADTGGGEIDKVSPAGILSVVAGTGSEGPSTAGPATRSELDYPYSVAVDGLGHLFVTDTFDNEVDEISPAGTLSVIAGTGTAAPPTAGPATRSDLDFPTGIAVDGLGSIYIADTFNNEVEKISAAGTLSVVATGSEVNHPYGLAVDPSGLLYIADTFSYRVETWTPGGVLSVIAGTGTQGVPTAGPATASELGQVDGVVTDGLGNLYAADFSNNVVVKVASAVAPSVVGIASVGRGRLLATSAGAVHHVGTRYHGAPGSVTAPIAGIAAMVNGGYLLATTTGNVYNYDTRYHGSPAGKITAPIAGIATVPDGGYLLATTTGNVYNYDTRYHGSPAASHVVLSAPIAGIATTPDGGYSLTTTTGTVYRYPA
jgi:sugar lactone lactonase YvrE